MEYTPETHEVHGLGYDAIKEAQATFSHLLKQDGYGDLGLSVGLSGSKDAYRVCIRVPDEELVVFAEMAADLYIPQVPVDVLNIGLTEAQ